MRKIIALAGNARTGKDTVAQMLKTCFTQDGRACVVVSFADALKEELQALCTSKLGISTHTEDSAEKEFLRPLFVTWGTHIRRKADPEYWIKKLDWAMYNNNVTYIISDLRFPNENSWIFEQGGTTIFLEREGVPPANEVEALNNQLLKPVVDSIWTVPTSRDLQSLQEFVKEKYECLKTSTLAIV